MTKPTKAEVRKSLQRSFDVLEKPIEDQGLEVRELFIGDVDGPWFAGCGIDGTWHVLVPAKAHEEIQPDKGSKGIQVEARELMDGGKRRHFVDLVCRIPRLRRLFLLVAEDLLTRLDGKSDVSTRASETLADWRELLARASRPVSEQRLLGVYAELLQLRELIRINPMSARCWRGPDGEVHDLESGGIAIEVKARSQRGQRVRINGLRQLVAAPGGRLALAVVTLDRASNGENIGELLGSLASMGADQELLLDKLAKQGVDPSESAARQARFCLRDERVFEVREDFPRLTPAELAAPLHSAISQLSYSIDLGAAAHCELSAAEVEKLREELVAT